jgi:histone deacetylase 1/2
MKRKRDLVTREVYKHKARLNVHGGQQQFGVNYFETYSPVVTWFSLRTLLTLSLLNQWYTRQIDFILAYPQAQIEFDMYMELPKGIEMADGSRKTHVLKLLKNLYGQKQAGRVWNQHLVKGLIKIGFKQSEIDECVFYRSKTIFVVYVDDGIFAGPDSKEIDQAIDDLQSAGFNVEDKGNIKDYLGVHHVTKLTDGRLKLWQLHLTQQIVSDVGLPKNVTTRTVPALSSKI